MIIWILSDEYNMRDVLFVLLQNDLIRKIFSDI